MKERKKKSRQKMFWVAMTTYPQTFSVLPFIHLTGQLMLRSFLLALNREAKSRLGEFAISNPKAISLSFNFISI